MNNKNICEQKLKRETCSELQQQTHFYWIIKNNNAFLVLICPKKKEQYNYIISYVDMLKNQIESLRSKDTPLRANNQ